MITPYADDLGTGGTTTYRSASPKRPKKTPQQKAADKQAKAALTTLRKAAKSEKTAQLLQTATEKTRLNAVEKKVKAVFAKKTLSIGHQILLFFAYILTAPLLSIPAMKLQDHFNKQVDDANKQYVAIEVTSENKDLILGELKNYLNDDAKYKKYEEHLQVGSQFAFSHNPTYI
ncbi:hypothetical protein COB21_01700 [Candidatus Aerophobetes bacterium]|uniref:Uncharacterized protein n=1 Tax=Aerophobetes bacterium TaxID=2030807 RepID=A0A2A4X6A6_UNCAE|nr:MAG: hypothetical protein COB21_01700 [Candidatus Aerophobetes bacterium]